jgi:hypothetical protein
MPTIITASTLRGVLGVDSALYSDAVLDDVIDTAETVILPMLVKYSTSVEKASRVDGVATYKTTNPHEFTVGQSVVISGVASGFNATSTVTVVEEEYSFSVTNAGADTLEFNVIPSGLATLSGAQTYVGNAAVESAVLSVSVEVFSNRIAAGNQVEGVDFAPAPFRLGRSLFNRVSGLLGSYMDVDSMVG